MLSLTLFKNGFNSLLNYLLVSFIIKEENWIEKCTPVMIFYSTYLTEDQKNVKQICGPMYA